MMYPDTDSSNTSSSENTELSSEDTDTETYEVAPRQTRTMPPSGFNKTAIVQQSRMPAIKGSSRIHYSNRFCKMDKKIETTGIETTQPKRGRGRPKKSVNDVQTSQSKKRASSNNEQIDAEHVLESLNKKRKN
ncbi:hypothetical protein BpHYR1_026766 [Brachionus plicatilis]|uniref:Uncharacterized protein n=1 Tax=Brachionus plicatilis TaxID=10195 RepID=A0A3M7QYG7_BRAPC|nr:hypothetical protein BpHYR1_026766 [Brachionus plicatilis]